MSEIDKILHMLAEHFSRHDGDLASKRKHFEKGGTAFQDWQNIKPVDGSYGNDLVITAPGASAYGDYGTVDLSNILGDNGYRYDPAAGVDAYDPNAPLGSDEIVVTAKKPPAPVPTTTPFNPTTATIDGSAPNLINNPETNDIVVTGKKSPPPFNPAAVTIDTSAPSLVDYPDPGIVVTGKKAPPAQPPTYAPWIGPELPTITDVTDVLTKAPPPPPPGLPANTTLDTSKSLLDTTEGGPRKTTPTSSSSSYFPGSVDALVGPALTYNPAAFSSFSAAAQLPSNYRALQPINLPNYANVYDILFQGQGANSPLGQSMLTPPDQSPNRLDAAMEAAHQAQQAQPAQEAPKQSEKAGKAHGGSVNDAIDGIIAYLQSIRR